MNLWNNNRIKKNNDRISKNINMKLIGKKNYFIIYLIFLRIYANQLDTFIWYLSHINKSEIFLWD